MDSKLLYPALTYGLVEVSSTSYSVYLIALVLRRRKLFSGNFSACIHDKVSKLVL